MCMDERCRHPYTCDCEEQCGGPKRCYRCNEELRNDRYDLCERCEDDMDEIDALEPKL